MAAAARIKAGEPTGAGGRLRGQADQARDRATGHHDRWPDRDATQLTAIALLLRRWGPGTSPAILALATLVLVSSRPAVGALWGALALLVAVRIAADWLADNHIYLLSYWSLGTALALGTATRRSCRGSRWLLGLAFAFAVLWKGVLSPDYLDGRFFRVTLTDPRFEDAALLFGGVTPETLAANRHALEVPPRRRPSEPAGCRRDASATDGHHHDLGRPAAGIGRDGDAAAGSDGRRGGASRHAARVLPDDVCVRAGRRVRLGSDRHGPHAVPAGATGAESVPPGDVPDRAVLLGGAVVEPAEDANMKRHVTRDRARQNPAARTHNPCHRKRLNARAVDETLRVFVVRVWLSVRAHVPRLASRSPS